MQKRAVFLSGVALILLALTGCTKAQTAAAFSSAGDAFSDITSAGASVVSAAGDAGTPVGKAVFRTEVFASYHAAAAARAAFYNSRVGQSETGVAAAKALDLAYDDPAYTQVKQIADNFPADVTVKSDIDLQFSNIELNADASEATAKTTENWVVTDSNNQVLWAEQSLVHTIRLRHAGPAVWVTYQIS